MKILTSTETKYPRTLDSFKKSIKIARKEVLDEELYRQLSDHFVDVERILTGNGKKGK